MNQGLSVAKALLLAFTVVFKVHSTVIFALVGRENN
jgi:uncharacterized protein (UPF0332 family)